jgi:hypothetical protein
MGDAERRSILVQIEVPAEVTGVVLGPDGAPVEGALVSFQSGDESPDSHWGGGTTDENGRFSLKWFPVPLADVHIEHSAYAVKIEPEVRLPRDGSELRFSLSRPRVVLVHVVDATGQEIPGVCVGASDVETDEILAFCYDHEDAAVRVGGLPEGEVVLWANVPGTQGDANVELRHDTSIPETKIVIPTQAKLIASWEMPRGQGIHAAFLVLSPTDGSLPLEYQLQEEGRRSGTIAVYAPPGEYEVHLKELSSRTNDRRLTEGTTATLSVGNTAGVTLTPIDAE